MADAASVRHGKSPSVRIEILIAKRFSCAWVGDRSPMIVREPRQEARSLTSYQRTNKRLGWAAYSLSVIEQNGRSRHARLMRSPYTRVHFQSV